MSRRRTDGPAYRVVSRIAWPRPVKGASRAERLRWAQRFYWSWNTPFVVVGAVIIIGLGWWYVGMVLIALQALALAYGSVMIRREERWRG